MADAARGAATKGGGCRKSWSAKAEEVLLDDQIAVDEGKAEIKALDAVGRHKCEEVAGNRDLSLQVQMVAGGVQPTTSPPDILVPQLRPGSDELPHEPNAFGVVDDGQLDAARANVVLGSAERPILSNDDSRNTI